MFKQIRTRDIFFEELRIFIYRRILRTLFNEAVRYEWITKNPVCATKIGAGSSNTTLRAVPEKEVFSFKEAQEFLKMLNGLSDDIINQRVCLKILLYTGIVNYDQLLPHLKKINRRESKMWKKYMQCLGIKKSVTPRKK